MDVPHTDRRVTEGVTLHPYKAAWLKDFDKVQQLVDTLFGRAK